MKTNQEFWDDAILAAVSNMAGRRDYGVEFPHALVNDAERIADALVELRQSRLQSEEAPTKQSPYDWKDFTVSGSGRCWDPNCDRCDHN